MIRRQHRPFTLRPLMVRCTLAAAAIGPLAVGCQDIWDIGPFDPALPSTSTPCQSYDNAANISIGTPTSIPNTGSDAPASDGGMTSSNETEEADGGTPVPCSALPHPIFIVGSDSVPPILEKIGPALAEEGTATLVYVEKRSCAAVEAVYATPTLTGTACFYSKDKASEGACANFGASECSLEGSLFAPGPIADIGVSDVFPETCGKDSSPHVEHRPGPVQAAIFVTTARSSQEVISWEAAKAIYDPASDQVASPWTDLSFVSQRITESGTQRLVATLLGLDPDTLMNGVSFTSSSNLISGIEQLNESAPEGDVDKVLGIYDVSNRDRRWKSGESGFETLAFQASDSKCGYKPDVNGFDKANVRNGRYVLWSPLHFVRRTDGDEEHMNSVTRVLDLILMDPKTSIDGVTKYEVFVTWVNRGFVPDCAMQVQRDSEMGELSTQTTTCTCAFERALMLNDTAGCGHVCNEIAPDCPARSHCDFRFGSCELDQQQ